MKAITIIITFTFISFLTGCYTTLGIIEEKQTDYSENIEIEELELEEDNITSSYFDEDMEEVYYEESEMEQNDVYYEESTNDFFTIFLGAVSEFFSSGAFNIVIDLSSGSSSSSSDSNYSDNNSRNNSGSRNYDGR
ncbi:MAG: hypothetical protein KJN64_09530 [Ignavibacteria bacterium]|nr:hypothetical protein [Ignavibacteria bacterium]MBT8382937.1 hypothetical protein [Ignavibacteria bacterium]MBT8391896.1 hypothetical protein [Ignavibacteria bacterium]NNJ53304.1 hypothetical protein [Ignavibacteriaceae bacterium]NNL22242.1 hypothetical protein [Ignavibacteriaceae bacterium]